MAGQSGEVMVMSNAVSLPKSQAVRRSGMVKVSGEVMVFLHTKGMTK